MYNLKQVKTKEKQIEKLSQDVQLIKSLLISVVGKDTEGVYRPEFVREILSASKERPTQRFKNASSFLQELQSV